MNKLSKDYKQSVTCVDGKLREQLLLDYAPLSVQLSTASTLSFRPTFVEDLISEGMLGLMDAFAKFDPTRDNKFKTYTEFRTKGAILDDHRKNYGMPRSSRGILKILDKNTKSLEQKHGP